MTDSTREATALEASAEGAAAFRRGDLKNPYRSGTLRAWAFDQGWSAEWRFFDISKRPLYPPGKAPL